VERPPPEGDLAALAARVIAQSECGNYGEDALTAWKLPDHAVVIERVAKDGSSRRWRVEAGDTLRVSGDAWGTTTMAGINTQLTLVTAGGEERELSHFEFSAAWGGPTDDDVAKLARTVALAVGCMVTVIPTTYPARAHERPAPKVEAPPPEIIPIAPAIPKVHVGDVAGASVLCSIVCGDDSDEHLRAIVLPDGTVVIENATTGAHWQIHRDDVLVITPFVVPSGPEGVWTCLERGNDRIAGCYWRETDRNGTDEAAVAAFVAKVTAVVGCNVDHRSLVWP